MSTRRVFVSMVLTIRDIEGLNDFAEEIITYLREYYIFFDNEGNYLYGMSEDERRVRMEEMIRNEKSNYLDFRNCEELKKYNFEKAFEIMFVEIKEKYLKDFLPMMRGIIRKGLCGYKRVVVSKEIDDDFLDDLFALRWKENLKLWANFRENRRGEQ